MPRNVRNFWVDLDVDGRANSVGTGPRSKDGGLDLDLYIRNDGRVAKALTVRCYRRHHDSMLVMSVRDGEGHVVHELETAR